MFQPVILRLALRYIRRRILQSLLFILGVALGVALVIAIDLANNSASRAFALSTESVTGKATHQISAGSTGVPTSLYTDLRRTLGLRMAAPIIQSSVRVIEADNRPLRVLGVDTFAEPPFRAYLSSVAVRSETGNTFEALTRFISEPNTALISQTLADRYGLDLGDTLTMRPGAQTTTVRIIGLLQPTDSTSQQALDDLLLMDIATAQESLGFEGRLSRIDLILPADYDTTQITAILPADAELTTVQQQDSALSQMTDAFEINLQALSLLAVVVGIFLIYNTVTFSVVQRRPVIGILRALGATRGQIFSFVIGEAFILGIVGTVCGMALGLILGRLTVGLVAQTISDLYFSVNVTGLRVDPFTLAKGAALGFAASLGAAFVPSAEATNTPPAGTMKRSQYEDRMRSMLPYLVLASIGLAIIGWVLLQLPTQSLIVSFAALFCVVLSGALITPPVLFVTMHAVIAPMGAVFGVLGRMAPRAVVRSLSRTSVAVAALTVAVSVIVGVSLMIGSFRSTVRSWLETTLGADIFIAPPQLSVNETTGDIDPSMRDSVFQTAGIARVSASRRVQVNAPDYPDLPLVNLNAVDFDIGFDRGFVWNNAPNGTTEAALDSGQIMVSEPFAFRRNITPENNMLTLMTDQGPKTFTIFGVFYDYSTDQGVAVMGRKTYDLVYEDRAITSLAAFIAPDADLDTVIERLKTTTLSGTDLQIQSNRALREGVFVIFERTFTITIALRLLATLVAFIGILSALLALQLEHTREYGVMRANGMTGRQLWVYTLLQTGLMGTVAGMLALPIGAVLALVLIYVINVRSFGWTMQLIPLPQEFITAFGVAVIASLIAGIYPAWRLSTLNTSQALRRE